MSSPFPCSYSNTSYSFASSDAVRADSKHLFARPSTRMTQLPFPTKVQRNPSDKTAIVSAAQALLSLMPPWNTCPTTQITSTENSRQVDDNQINPCKLQKQPSLIENEMASMQEVCIPELADDPCQSISVQPTSNSDEDRRHSGFLGSTSLALPEDEEFLSPMHCFMRKYCVEAFANDIESNGGQSCGRRIPLGQVGIRCLFCKDEQDPSRGQRAICFPSSLPNLYHSVETWQRRHSRVCSRIPAWVRCELHQLKSQSRSGAGGRRHYWVLSAQRIGLVETAQGLRFSHPPGVILDIPNCPAPQDTPEKLQAIDLSNVQSFNLPLVKSEERFMVTDYLFVLMEQMEMCYFSEQDRKGTRSKNNHEHALGFPGMQCRHCRGKAGCGRYFPITLRALTSANSDRNLWNHLRKCRKCSDSIRARIEQFQLDSAKETNRRGSRKQFFTNIWHRLHASERAVSDCSV